jgi:hypothetical protein
MRSSGDVFPEPGGDMALRRMDNVLIVVEDLEAALR